MLVYLIIGPWARVSQFHWKFGPLNLSAWMDQGDQSCSIRHKPLIRQSTGTEALPSHLIGGLVCSSHVSRQLTSCFPPFVIVFRIDQTVEREPLLLSYDCLGD